MLKQLRSGMVCVLAAAMVAASAMPAWAVYSNYGYGMPVETGSYANAALNVQVANDLWLASSQSGQSTSTYTNSFGGLTCDGYAKAWLVTTVYGGTASNTATVTATVNGHTIASPTVGTTTDANTNAFGSTVGLWVLSLPIDPSYLNSNGTANQVSVSIGNKTKGAGASAVFDGRSMYQSLVTVSQDDSLNNTLDYAFAAGGGDIGKAPSSYLTSRTLDMGSLGSGTVTSARAHAIYTYGDLNQKDKLLFNGTALVGDDVANKKNGVSSPTYPADVIDTDVTSFVQSGTNSLKFTVDAADFDAGASLETSLRPQLAILDVTRVVPEPATLVLLAFGGVAALRRSRRMA
jgi:hypothetical protein